MSLPLSVGPVKLFLQLLLNASPISNYHRVSGIDECLYLGLKEENTAEYLDNQYGLLPAFAKMDGRCDNIEGRPTAVSVSRCLRHHGD